MRAMAASWGSCVGVCDYDSVCLSRRGCETTAFAAAEEGTVSASENHVVDSQNFIEAVA
jgi:hypothetical protein